MVKTVKMENSFPKYISIQTTSFCNGHCVFCPNDRIKGLFPQKIMDAGLYKRIIDECSLYNPQRVILYMNNEPLTDPYLIERINYAKKKIPEASVHILTNAGLLTEELAAQLIDSGLDWIGFSFHGIKKETIEKAMGLDFDSTMKNILNFIEKAKEKRNIKEFIMLTFLKHQYLSREEEQDAKDFWRKLGIERISYFEKPISRAGNVEGLAKIRSSCIAGCSSIWANEMIHVAEDGRVLLCCMDWRREAVIGDLNSRSISELWNSPEYSRARDKRDGIMEMGGFFDDFYNIRFFEVSLLIHLNFL